jgi:CubicO group peptidase (beta-lactamase class C family)
VESPTIDPLRRLTGGTAREPVTTKGKIAISIRDHGDRFGYGFGVLSEAGRRWDVASAGSYSWGGIFHTYFWVDPKNKLIGVLMTQVFVADDITLRFAFKKRAYECLED